MDKSLQKNSVKSKQLKIYTTSFDRPNIFYQVEPKIKPFQKLLDFLQTRKKRSGIVYCLARKTTQSLANYLNKNGFKASSYHALLPNTDKERVLEEFQQDKIKIVGATIAFGMGIDKSNVRFVVHWNLPKSFIFFRANNLSFQ